jgi:hypothetical protein
VPIDPAFRNYRFVVQGQIVPEPSVIELLFAVLMSGYLTCTRYRK